MPALSEHSSVYGTAVQTLREKGYQVWYDEETETYCAEREGWDFFADSPCSLLGLVAIYEHQGPPVHAEYWWRQEPGGEHYRDLPREPSVYRSVSAPSDD